MVAAVIEMPLFTATQLRNNIVPIALLVVAGPVAFTICSMFEGGMRDRAFAAFGAGIIATIAVVIAAALGSALPRVVEMGVFKIGGAISLVLLSLVLLGVPIPSVLLLLPTLGGLVLGVIVKLV